MIPQHGQIDLAKADAHCYGCAEIGKFADQIVVICATTHRPRRLCPKCAAKHVAAGTAFRKSDCK